MIYKQKFIVVTGVSKSHLLRTARLLHEARVLRCAITSYIPSRKKSFKYFPKSIRSKFLSRLENVDSVTRHSFLIPEIIYQFGRLLHKAAFPNVADNFLAYAFKLNSIFTNKIISKSPNSSNEVILVRAGFGSEIIFDERIFVCDASLAHPKTMEQLLNNGEFGLTPNVELSKVDNLILKDLDRADAILVNSDFVRESFIFAGVQPDRIITSYLPPLPQFNLIEKPREPNEGTLKLLFAGGLEKRKGIYLVNRVITLLEESGIFYEFILIGNWGEVDPEVKNNLLSNKSVTWIPWVREAELAKKMQEANLFVFPSYAEGGARVVTEAMAVGLPVITTRNSGSPITHEYDGVICNLDPNSIFDWIMRLYRDSETMKIIGQRAMETIRNSISDEIYLSKIDIDFSIFRNRKYANE